MNAITNNGGPAFPATNWSKDGDFLGDNQGMTLRDYFAAKAMQAGLTTATLPGLDKGNPEVVALVESAAVAFYRIADAMLKARAA